MRLSTIGCIRETVVDYEEAALFSARFMHSNYPTQVENLLKTADPRSDAIDVQIIESFGQKRGAIKSGGYVDFERAARSFVMDIRSGAMGRLTLELPEETEQENWKLQNDLKPKKLRKHVASRRKMIHQQKKTRSHLEIDPAG